MEQQQPFNPQVLVLLDQVQQTQAATHCQSLPQERVSFTVSLLFGLAFILLMRGS